MFSGPGGALRNNTSKGRPAPPIQTHDIVDSAAFKQKTDGDQTKSNQDSVSSPTSSAPPLPPAKDERGFEDDAWSVKPSKQPTSAPEASKSVSQTASNAPQQPTLTGSLLDLSLLSTPLQPTPAQPTAPQQTQQVPNQPPMQAGVPSPPPSQPVQQQQTGANPTFFSQLGQSQAQTTGSPLNQNFTPQQGLAPPQAGLPRQRPQAPPQIGQPGAIMPPPPARPLSAPQTQQPSSNFAPPPLQPQLTGYRPQNQFSNQIAPPGLSLNDLNQQRFHQQLYNQQQQQQQQQFLQQQLQSQPTGFVPQPQNFSQFTPHLQPQVTGFQQPSFQNPYVSGQQQGSPFADPRGPKPQFQTAIQPQPTGFQAQPMAFNAQYQQQQPPMPLQPAQTGINASLPPALQPQNTGIVNGLSQPGFGQSITIPPVPPIPQMPSAAPLQPQKTGPAPNIRFGTQPANKLVPQPTGRKANLSAASKFASLSLSIYQPSQVGFLVVSERLRLYPLHSSLQSVRILKPFRLAAPITLV